MTNPPAPSSLPEEAYNLAAQHGLGTPQAQYQRHLNRRSLVVEAVIGLAGIAAFIFITISLPLGSVWRSAGFYLGFLTVFVLGQMIRDLSLHRLRILICTGGLVWRRGKKLQVVRWEEVESVIDGNTALEAVCTIRKIDGTALICLIDRSQTKELGTAVARATEPYLLPRALESYRSGTSVHFGKLISIGQDGIHNKRKFLPWNHYSGYFMEENVLTILQRDGEFWTDAPLPKIPNLHVLTGLLDTIRQSQVQSVP